MESDAKVDEDAQAASELQLYDWPKKWFADCLELDIVFGSSYTYTVPMHVS